MGWVDKQVSNIPVVGPIYSGVNNAFNKTATQVFQPLEKAVVQPVSQGLASLDKTVGQAIPGGWGTVASIAGSAMGVPTPLLVGLGALNGSGVTHKGGKFNLQGAMMGGALAYGASQLGEYARGASDSAIKAAAEGASNGAVPVVEAAAKSVPVDAIESLNASQGWTGPAATNLGSNITQASIDAANASAQAAADAASKINPVTGVPFAETGSGLAGNGMQPSVGSQIMNGEFGNAATQTGQNIQRGFLNAGQSIGEFKDAALNPNTYENALSKGFTNASNTGSGISNLLSGGSSVLPNGAAAAFPYAPAAATLYGAMGLKALDEQKKYLEESRAANTISQAEYDKAVAEINRSAEDARRAVAEHPFSTNPDVGGSLSGSGEDNPESWATAYEPTERSDARLYASGGTVTAPNMVNPPDDQTGMPSQSPLSRDFGMSGFMGNSLEALKKLLAGSNSNSNNASPQYDQRPQDFDRPAPVGYPQPAYSGGAAQGTAGLGGISPAGGGSNAFPLEGQYGIVKLAKGGEVPRFGFGGMFPGGGYTGAASGEAGSGGGGGGGFFGNIARSGIIQAVGQAPIPDAGKEAVAAHPFNTNPDMSPDIAININSSGSIKPTDLLYSKNKDAPTYDSLHYASGGMAPRFLSGGGDGMSDSIPANIGGTQEARLADGEFVVPADVVSHLGNGSSKAGAKQLYSMMDRVRTARTGRKSQGKQINPKKYMAA